MYDHRARRLRIYGRSALRGVTAGRRGFINLLTLMKYSILPLLAVASLFVVSCNKEKAAIEDRKDAAKEAIEAKKDAAEKAAEQAKDQVDANAKTDKANIEASKEAVQAQADADKAKVDAAAAAEKAKVDAEKK